MPGFKMGFSPDKSYIEGAKTQRLGGESKEYLVNFTSSRTYWSAPSVSKTGTPHHTKELRRPIIQN